jgi:signal transduction histidine kinase
MPTADGDAMPSKAQVTARSRRVRDRRSGRMRDTSLDADWLVAVPRSRFPFWDVVPLTVVLLTLLGSVVMPARQTWRIQQLLRETTDVLAPARLLVEELQTGLAKELVGLQRFALSADRALLEHHGATANDDDGRLAALARLAQRLDSASAERIEVVRHRVAEWREGDDSLLGQRGSQARFAAALRAEQPRYDAALEAIAALSSGLAAAAAARDRQVVALEHVSIVSNAALVLATFAAMSGVLILTLRQRRFLAMLRLRTAEEVALRQLARRLSAVGTRREALRCIAEDTLAITRARGAYVEWTIPGRRVLACLATAGERVLMTCSSGSYDGSLTEAHATAGGPAVLTELPLIDEPLAARAMDVCGRCPGLIIPLLSADVPLGVLVLQRHPTAPALGDDARRQLRLVSDLASEALRRVDGMAVERAALKQARRRARREAALRAAAEALGGAYTAEEVTQRIAHAALDAMPAHGAFVEEIAGPAGYPAEVVVRAVAGLDASTPGAACLLAGSYTELVTESGEPMLIGDLAHSAASAHCSALQRHEGSAIIVPLGTGRKPVGALFVVSAAAGHFRAGDVMRAGILGHLAALAYERVSLLNEANARQAVLERVVKSRSRLIRGFSHDVKNSVGAADGFAELISLGVYGELPGASQASIDRLRGSLRTAIALIDDLHELGRAETGRIALTWASVDVGALMHTVVDEYHATAQRKGLSLSMTVDPDVPSIETDPARVRQVASNLLSNAIKYTAHGSVLVRIRHQPAGPVSEDGDWMLVEFTDSGVGIPADKEEYIFEEFSRLGNAQAPGAGLGLAISRLLARALGGEISVESELGHGSTFTLRLPLRPPPRAEP